jgi:hypothetical protein
MEQRLVAAFGVESSGMAIFCRREGERAIFWSEWGNMCPDEEGDDTSSHVGREAEDLAEILSGPYWIMCYPLEIDPAFVPWFREAYGRALASLSAEERQRYRASWHRAWQTTLGLGEPTD